jgi:hypothetical protein
MVPSEKSTTILHTSETDPGVGTDNSIASALSEGGAKALEAMLLKANDEENRLVLPEVEAVVEPPKPEIDSRALDNVDLELDKAHEPFISPEISAQLASTAIQIEPPQEKTIDIEPIAINPDAPVAAPDLSSVTIEAMPMDSKPEKDVSNTSEESRGAHHHELHASRVAPSARPSQAPAVEATPAPQPTPRPTPAVVAKPKPAPVAVEPPRQSRPEFVKQQEALWGAKDKIAPEAVPEGEMTYEQYLAQRPKAEEGDIIHATDKKGNTILFDAVTGRRTKAEDHIQYDDAAAREAEQSYYANFQAKDMLEKTHDEALPINEVKTRNDAELIQLDAEGERLVAKELHLQDLLVLGEEILELHNSKLGAEAFEARIAPELERKKRQFNDLRELYGQRGDDQRVLDYITNKTMSFVEDPEYVRVEGSAFHADNKVTIVDVAETPDGQSKTYTVQGEEGEAYEVAESDVAFKREYQIPEQEQGKMDRFKNWFSKEYGKLKEFGASAYFAGKWHDRKSWINRNTEGKTPEEAEAQRKTARTWGMLGLTAGVLTTSVIGHLTGTSVSEIFGGGDVTAALGPDLTGPELTGIGGNGATSADIPLELRTEMPTLDNAEMASEVVDASAPEAAPAIPVEQTVENPAFNIPDGGSLTGLFEDLDLNTDVLEANKSLLAERFPGDFGIVNGDIRINRPGWLSTEARNFLLDLKWQVRG